MWLLIHNTVEVIGWIAIACVLVTLCCLMFGASTVPDTKEPEPIIRQKAQRERFAHLDEEEWRHG